MKLLRLFGRMLRYRVAIMLALFFLLGAATRGLILTVHYQDFWQYVCALIALAASYVAATTVNDIADYKVDQINHPHSPGRPLVTGEATRRDLVWVHLIAAALALGLAYLAGGLKAGLVIAVSLAINYLYSARPFRFSYRTYFAPVILSVAYVFIPFWLGVIVGGGKISRADGGVVGALLVLFVGRILLKDFRDRKGDSAYGKPTFLLRWGKTATCITSFCFIALGNIFLFMALPLMPLASGALLELFFLAIFWMLYRLWKADDPEAEQAAIGIGAKMGNGSLVTLLGFLVLRGYGAPAAVLVSWGLVITTAFLVNFVLFLRHPQYALIGYRG